MPFEAKTASSTGATAGDDLDVLAERYAHDRIECHAAEARRLRDDLIAALLPFARRLARRYRNSGEPFTDLEQVARVGLVKAVDRYDPDRGSFTAYAVSTVVGEIKRYFRDHTWGVRVPRRLQDLAAEITGVETVLVQELGRRPTDAEIAQRCAVDELEIGEARLSAAGYRPVSLFAPVGDGGDQLGDLMGSADPAIDLVSDQITVARLVQMLPERERRILTLRFYGDLTQAEIAEKLGMSQMHVSRLLARILCWLREAMLSDTVPRWPGAESEPDCRLTVATQAPPTGSLRVQVSGEVDRDNAVHLRDTLLRAVRLASGRRRVNVDLSGVPLLDAAGVGVLVAVKEAARARDIAVTVTGLQPFVRRIAEASGLSAMLEPDRPGPETPR